MMKRIILVFSILGLPGPEAFAQWSLKPSATTQNLYDVFFVNTQTGYCVGDNGTVLKTVDEGETWTSVFNADTSDLTALHFKDENTGWVCGSRSAFQTNNGGNSFISLEPLFGNTDITKQLISADIAGAKDGIVIITAMYSQIPQTSPASFYSIITRNGGVSWQAFNYPGGVIQIVNDTVFYAAHFMIRKSVDGGNTWFDMDGSSLAFPPLSRKTFKVADMNGSGWASLAYHMESVNIAALTGNSVAISSSNNLNIHSASFLLPGQSKGYFLRYVDGSTRVYTSADMGVSFEPLGTQTVNANNIHFVNSSLGFLCGNNGYIYKTSTADVSVAESHSASVPQINIYPNPSGEKVILGCEKDVEIQDIRLTDLSGKVIRTFENNGSVLDVSGVAKGVYFLNLKANGKSVNEKIVIH